MELFSFLFFFVVGVIVGFWMGFRKGYVQHVFKDVTAILEQMPVNVEISQIGDSFYGHQLGTKLFVGQSTNRDELFKIAALMFPDRVVIMSDAQEE